MYLKIIVYMFAEQYPVSNIWQVITGVISCSHTSPMCMFCMGYEYNYATAVYFSCLKLCINITTKHIILLLFFFFIVSNFFIQLSSNEGKQLEK